MNREYQKWYSSRLGRDMEMLVFGHGGLPMLVFPTSMGRFYEYEDNGMIAAVSHLYEQGQLQAFCVDSVDTESWYNKSAHPRDRVLRHLQYESYVMEEVMPFLRNRNWSRRIMTTGCSFGAYHAMNLALRHPDLITDCVCMGGAYNIRRFLGGYSDDNVYFNNPPDYLANMGDGWQMDQYRNNHRFVLATGDYDICLGENFQMAHTMGTKYIPHTLDVWGNGTAHDWPWWHGMAQKFFP